MSIFPKCTFLRKVASALAALLVVFVSELPASAEADNVWNVGRFSFSDELGGFTIQNVTGTGTRRNPFTIWQTFDTATSATLVIRTRDMRNVAKVPNNNITHSSFHVQIITLNNTRLPWIGLGFELQETIDVASTYGDGLSFDQLARREGDIYSNRFASYEDEFEPGDRLVYTNGHVDDQTSVTTKFIITDFTPAKEFYLFQNPMVPAS